MQINLECKYNYVFIHNKKNYSLKKSTEKIGKLLEIPHKQYQFVELKNAAENSVCMLQIIYMYNKYKIMLILKNQKTLFLSKDSYNTTEC